MKKILTVGVFDLLHYGHIELFRRAKELGGELIVAVQKSEYVVKFKPQCHLVYSTEERLYMVGSIRYVDHVTTYCSVDKIVKDIDFDVFVIGEDQNHSGFLDAIRWSKSHGKEVVVFSRTKGISTSTLKNLLQKHD